MNAMWSRKWSRPLAVRYGVTAILCVLCLALFLHTIASRETKALKPGLRRLIESRNDAKIVDSEHASPDVGIVIAKTRLEDVNWLLELYQDFPFRPFIYSMESSVEPGCLAPRSRRGREIAAYLSYIIDNYDSLPGYSIFMHAKDEQWHNDVLGQKAADTIKALRFKHINVTGFTNLRCTLIPGCPLGVNPLDPTEQDIRNKDTRAFFAEIYMELFDVTREQVPKHIGNVCCAQFAVTRARILARPRLDYERMLRWADQSREDDFAVGWVFEKVWDTVFGMDAIK
ncbi:hypothetical protein QM012_003585 [Aureobasidium pullulans]|uniref:Uncharacterized protein n=1 Tax=Aureobasidium pullulans TaxID=5580 RepID=A0ABR0TA49_AURPU